MDKSSMFKEGHVEEEDIKMDTGNSVQNNSDMIH